MFLNRYAKKTDEDLMVLIQRGEQKAFTELYHRYSRLMVRYFFRMLWRDENKAQDFLQDLFVKIIERPQYFDPSKKFSTWIYSVAHNMCKNEYRKQNYRDVFQREANRSSFHPDTIHEEIDQRDFSKALDAAMLEWPEEDRHLFVLRHELEMTFGEIADTIKCPEGTAKSRWFYLRKELAKQFQEFQSILK